MTCLTAGASCGLFRGCAVVDDVYLVHASTRERNLVQVRVVVDAVAVHPIGTPSSVARSTDVVDVDFSGMVFHRAVIVLARVVILDQVVPSVPLPYNFSIIGPHRFDLNDVVGPNVVLPAGGVAGNGGVSPCLQGFCLCFVLPSDHEDVAVRHGLDVMMGNVLLAVVGPRPLQGAIPRDTFHFAGGAPAGEVADRVGGVVGRTE